jgi:hypothetical protein
MADGRWQMAEMNQKTRKPETSSPSVSSAIRHLPSAI